MLTHQAKRALQYASTQGEPELREQVAARLGRQLPTEAEQIQVTSGSQEGLFLVGMALLDVGDVVLVEQPTYLAAVQAFSLAGGRLVAVPSDDGGMLPDALAETLLQLPQPRDAEAWAVVCLGRTCLPPVTDAQALIEALAGEPLARQE